MSLRYNESLVHGDDKLPQIGASDVTCALGDIDLGSDPLVELKKWVVGVLSKVVGATEFESRTEVPPVVRTVISARSNGTDATAVFEERYNSVRSQGMRTLSIRSKALSLSPATKDLAGLPVISYAPLAKNLCSEDTIELLEGFKDRVRDQEFLYFTDTSSPNNSFNNLGPLQTKDGTQTTLPYTHKRTVSKGNTTIGTLFTAMQGPCYRHNPMRNNKRWRNREHRHINRVKQFFNRHFNFGQLKEVNLLEEQLPCEHEFKKSVPLRYSFL